MWANVARLSNFSGDTLSNPSNGKRRAESGRISNGQGCTFNTFFSSIAHLTDISDS
ncbi:hypothetical protein [Paenibacillus eucommiae]|uniref:Uncharacterized protein n=1 Tax=Paenibacillus eucommiae TaxID=1355755 RepID=A0ABS4J3H1_9BACL|nr:hypothetical protein [Paenibacillus eucommiae]MBP1993656.1 hypothetical protein [Paenibacillus eucommiae]